MPFSDLLKRKPLSKFAQLAIALLDDDYGVPANVWHNVFKPALNKDSRNTKLLQSVRVTAGRACLPFGWPPNEDDPIPLGDEVEVVDDGSVIDFEGANALLTDADLVAE